MTPFGHIGGGLLVAVTAEKLLFKEEFSAAAVGMVVFLSILPDLDVILAFLFRSWKPGVKKARPSRLFYPHADILRLLIDCNLAWNWVNSRRSCFCWLR